MTEPSSSTSHRPADAAPPTAFAVRPATPPPKGGRRRILWPVLAVVALAAGTVLTVLTLRRAGAEQAPELELSGRLAVLPIVNATGDAALDWVGVGLTEMVTETLARTPGVAVIPSRRLRRVVTPRLPVDAADAATRRRWRELAAALGAELAADARIERERSGYWLELVVHGAGGEHIAGAQMRAPDLVAVTELFTDALASGLTTGLEPARLGTVFTDDAVTLQLYGMGVDRLARDGAERARPHFEIALRRRPRLLAAELKLAECARLTGEAGRAETLTRDVLIEAENRGDRSLRGASYAHLGLLAALDGRYDTAVGFYEQAQAAAIERDDLEGRAEIERELARLALAEGAAGRAEALFVEQLAGRQATGDQLGEIEALAQLAALALRRDAVDEAAELLEKGARLAAEVGDVRGEMQARSSLGEVALRRGDEATAIEQWQRALDFYEGRGDRVRQLLLGRNLAEARLAAGALDEAEDGFHDVAEIAAEIDRPRQEAAANLHLALILLRRGYPFQAETYLDRALELDRFIEDRVELQRAIAWLAYSQDNLRLAAEAQRQAKRQAGDAWTSTDEAFLEVYEEALATGRRLPLPPPAMAASDQS